jgi:cell division protein FtsL
MLSRLRHVARRFLRSSKHAVTFVWAWVFVCLLLVIVVSAIRTVQTAFAGAVVLPHQLCGIFPLP